MIEAEGSKHGQRQGRSRLNPPTAVWCHTSGHLSAPAAMLTQGSTPGRGCRSWRWSAAECTLQRGCERQSGSMAARHTVQVLPQSLLVQTRSEHMLKLTPFCPCSASACLSLSTSPWVQCTAHLRREGKAGDSRHGDRPEWVAPAGCWPQRCSAGPVGPERANLGTSCPFTSSVAEGGGVAGRHAAAT